MKKMCFMVPEFLLVTVTVADWLILLPSLAVAVAV
jgi:hypothetical protein